MAATRERGKGLNDQPVSQKVNIHPQTLRLYEREGMLKPSRTTEHGLYSEEDPSSWKNTCADARPRRQPCRRGNHPEHAPTIAQIRVRSRSSWRT